MDCAGCGRAAELQIKESELFICIPCSKLLPGLRTTMVAEPGYCPECDERLWHGQKFCHYCVEDVIRYVYSLEPGLCDDNVFVFDLVLPGIRFHQGAHLAEPSACPRSEFWYDLHIRDSVVSISFSGLRESEGMLARLPPRKCDCCGNTERKAQLYICDSFEEEFLWCEECRQVMARWLTKENLAEHPFVKMFLMTEESGSEFDVWYPSLYDQSNSFGSTRFRVK